jgi:hypothetical protein
VNGPEFIGSIPLARPHPLKGTAPIEQHDPGYADVTHENGIAAKRNHLADTPEIRNSTPICATDNCRGRPKGELPNLVG